MTIRGFLNIDKPAGMTSRDAVDCVQRLVEPIKAGHAGTLDPLATGVLVVAVGPATRLIDFVQQMPKQYRATFLFGRSSTTEDIEGDVTLEPEARVPTREEIAAAAARLTGEILQRPPAFSALKVAGRRAYELARRGQTPVLAPRPVTIYRFDLLRYEYPELQVDIRCGTGTYVRSLGRDLAISLGTTAVMSALVRTAVGTFRLEDAKRLDQLTLQNFFDWLLPVGRAVEHLPRYNLSATETIAVRHGRYIAVEGLDGNSPYAAFDPQGELVAILAARGPGLMGPERVLPAE